VGVVSGEGYANAACSKAAPTALHPGDKDPSSQEGNDVIGGNVSKSFKIILFSWK